jgi:hypothetical protein
MHADYRCPQQLNITGQNREKKKENTMPFGVDERKARG